jgi:hypothetical protein
MFFWENGEEKKAEENASKRNDYKGAKRAWEAKEQIKLFTHGILRNRFITATVSHTFFEGHLNASILVQRHDQTKRIRKATAVYHFMGHTVTVIVCVVVKSGFEPIQGLWSTPLGFRYQGPANFCETGTGLVQDYLSAVSTKRAVKNKKWYHSSGVTTGSAFAAQNAVALDPSNCKVYVQNSDTQVDPITPAMLFPRLSSNSLIIALIRRRRLFRQIVCVLRVFVFLDQTGHDLFCFVKLP